MDDRTPSHKGGERIAKVIARAGLASRRDAETWIAEGRVAVNGAVITSAALNVTARDRVTVDGKALPARERTRLFLYYKPRGLMTTHADPEGRPTIFQRLPAHLPRLISVGRLDFNTEGLLLLTNDGALARVLELPATGWLRRYRVRAHGSITQPALDALRNGVTVSGIHYGAIDATLERVQGSNLWLTFAIREGKNREVRNVLTHLGLTVTRLIRVSFGPFQLGELAEGGVEEVRTRVLREQLGARLVALSGADFSASIAPPAQPREEPRSGDRRSFASRLPGKSAKQRQHGQPSAGHTWRTPGDEHPTKPLHRKFHGARRDQATEKGRDASAPARVDVLTDRKGRAIPVERHGDAPRPPAPKPQTNKRPGRRRRSADRASGPRPRFPRGKA
jgi:23S rRNA pseudouridine2605 synthase